MRKAKHTYIEGSPAETQIPIERNLIGSSTTAPPPVLSPSSTLPSCFFHRHFVAAKKIGMGLRKYYFSCLLFYNCVSLKLRKLESACLSWQCSSRLPTSIYACICMSIDLSVRLSVESRCAQKAHNQYLRFYD
jgi:hypothetical protein